MGVVLGLNSLFIFGLRKKIVIMNLPEIRFMQVPPLLCGCQNLKIIYGNICLRGVMEDEQLGFTFLSLYNPPALDIFNNCQIPVT